MAIYAIGDIQGHYYHLRKLLVKIQFDPACDQLWLTGDLVNRGPCSLETLRFVKNLGDSARTVLGNHDLHLLAAAAGVREIKNQDSLRAILSSPDRDELLLWLRHRPFVYQSKKIRTIMSHSGIYVKWGRKKAIRYARELEATLQGDDYVTFLQNMRGLEPVAWRKSLSPWDRYRFIADAFTRMRFCSANGELDLKHKGAPGSQPGALTPWFLYPKRRCNKWRIVFGHWASLGYYNKSNVICVESGCLWGRQLTAVRLDSEQEEIWQVNCEA